MKASLTQNPTFKEQLQIKTRGVVKCLVKEARDFALEAVLQVRDREADPDRKVVLIVDSVERLRGVGDAQDVREVFKAPRPCSPPTPTSCASPGSPSRPAEGQEPDASGAGIGKMCAIVEQRYPAWRDFFAETQLRRLAQSSGGDLRDYFRMPRLSIARAPALPKLPVPDQILTDAEDAVRSDMLPIAADDRAWLASIKSNHDPNLPSLDQLSEFARLQQGKYVLQYRNGKDWYDVHPLLRCEVVPSGDGAPHGLGRSGGSFGPIWSGPRLSVSSFSTPVIPDRSRPCASCFRIASSYAPCGSRSSARNPRGAGAPGPGARGGPPRPRGRTPVGRDMVPR